MDPSYTEISAYSGEIYTYADTNYKLETSSGGANFGTNSNFNNWNVQIWGASSQIGLYDNTIKLETFNLNTFRVIIEMLPKYSALGEAGVAALEGGTLYAKNAEDMGLTYSGTFVMIAGI
jgi:hypothetical protein